MFTFSIHLECQRLVDAAPYIGLPILQPILQPISISTNDMDYICSENPFVSNGSCFPKPGALLVVNGAVLLGLTVGSTCNSFALVTTRGIPTNSNLVSSVINQ